MSSGTTVRWPASDQALPGGHRVVHRAVGSGKSTVAAAVERLLVERGRPAYVLDGDNLRHGLNADLGFSARTAPRTCGGWQRWPGCSPTPESVALVPLISPYRADRDRARAIHAAAGLPFFEVFVDTPLELCERRDPKGLYAKARAGEITGFTGVDDPYEPPDAPDLVLTPRTDRPTSRLGSFWPGRKLSRRRRGVRRRRRSTRSGSARPGSSGRRRTRCR